MRPSKNVKTQNSSLVYAMFIIFASLEEPKTSKQLLDEVNTLGFEKKGLRSVQRMLRNLVAAGFPIERKAIRTGKGNGFDYVWQWTQTKNIDDNIMQAKSLIVLEKFKEAA
jgi:predicted transcriptional regulator